MNFDFTEEQTLIADSVTRFVQDKYDLESRRALASSRQGFSTEHWQTMAELGWLGLPLTEADGGFGGNQVDTMLVMEQFGKGLVLEPFLASIVLGAGAVKRSSNAALRAEILPGVVDGTRQLALAYAEEQSRFDLNDVVTTVTQEANGYRLNGHKSMVLHGASAHQVIVSARLNGGQTELDGIILLAVDTDAQGVTCSGFPTVDGLQAAEFKFDNVQVRAERLVAGPQDGYALLNEVATDGILALCAEAVGAMEILYKDTVEYTAEREQFGHALAQFQVLQHRMVEMFMEYEQSKSLLYRATMETAQGMPTAQRTVHALKYLIGKNAVFIGENAVQLHGGMGMTEELRIGHYFKRLLVLEAQFGNTDFHLQKFAA
jgi:alkylation response protein AidB-like acyl-CoA dehydrogenase